MTQAQNEEHLRALVGRIFTDQKFVHQLESDPENALRQAGISLSEPQREAIQAGARQQLAVPGAGEAVAAFVSPVVRVVTQGTRPVVNVVVSSAVVAEKK